MRKIFLFVIISMISASSFSQFKNGYEIDITVHGLQDSVIFLAYHLGDKQYIKDTLKLDRAGHTKAMGKEVLPQGIYMVVLPGKKYFEILISEDQHFALNCSFTDYFNTLIFTGSDENSAFVDYQKKWIIMQQRASANAKRIQNNKQNADSLKILSATQKLQEDSMKSYLISVIDANKGNLLATLIKSILPLDVPEFSVPSVVANPDSVLSLRKYIYNKDHFFDNIDLTDERLLRTPILAGQTKCILYRCCNSVAGFNKQGD